MAELLKTIADLETKNLSLKDAKIGVEHCMTSISSEAAKTTYFFPMMLSKNVDPESAYLIADYLDYQYANFMRACFQTAPAIKVDDDMISVESYLKRFHQNQGIKGGMISSLRPTLSFKLESAISDKFGKAMLQNESANDLKPFELLSNKPLNESFNKSVHGNDAYSTMLSAGENMKRLQDLINKDDNYLMNPDPDGEYKNYKSLSQRQRKDYENAIGKYRKTIETLSKGVQYADPIAKPEEFRSQMLSNRDISAVTDANITNNINKKKLNFDSKKLDFDNKKLDELDYDKLEFDKKKLGSDDDELNDYIQNYRDGYGREAERLKAAKDLEATRKAEVDAANLARWKTGEIEKRNTSALPVMVPVDIVFLSGEHHQIPVSIAVGIKTVIHDCDPAELRQNIKDAMFNGNLKSFIQWTSGEVKSLGDVLFGIKQMKTAIGGTTELKRWKDTVMRRKMLNKLSFGLSARKPYLPNVSIVLSIEDVNRIKDETQIDLIKDMKYVYRLIKENMLLSFIVADSVNEKAYILFDGYASYTSLPYKAIMRDTTREQRQMEQLMRLALR